MKRNKAYKIVKQGVILRVVDDRKGVTEETFEPPVGSVIIVHHKELWGDEKPFYGLVSFYKNELYHEAFFGVIENRDDEGRIDESYFEITNDAPWS